MNGDLISREALVSEFAEKCVGECSVCIFGIYTGSDLPSCGLIEKAPAVDAEPVRHGRWVRQDETFTRFMCSACKARNYEGYEKYCPDCGAKMDGEGNG